MKKLIVLFAVILMMTGFSTKVMAQATENTAAGAEIISPISISETSPLHFGSLSVLAGTPGTCILSTTGGRTQTAGVNLSAAAPVFSNAAYSVGGAASVTYAITLPATINVTSGVPSMTINNLLARTASAGVDGLTGTLSAGGADTFTIGGTLNVAAAQATGTYTGTFNVTVAYN